MTEQEWLEARARGLELRRRIEEGITKALIESGVIKDCAAYMVAAEQCVHPTIACCRAEIISGIRQGESSLCAVCGGTCG